jgi:3-isopropylmalate dehydrogenase
MLDHLGHVEPAAAVRAAVENDLAARAADPALASRGTVRTGDDLVAAIAGR